MVHISPVPTIQEKKVALVFVGPEAPLCAGLADALNAKGRSGGR